MKKFTVLFLMIFLIIKGQAQNYQISFAGKGASTGVDSVNVQNLTQCKSLTLKGSDILNLTITTGINELGNRQQATDNEIIVYPNPVTDYCMIEFEAVADGNTTIELYDIAGKKLTQVLEFLFKGKHTYSLSGTGSGIYVIKIESNQYSYSARIISLNSTEGIAEIKHVASAPASGAKEQESNTGVMKSLRYDKSLINMEYNAGDILELTGFSGIYSTLNMIVPVQSQTITFDFIACIDGDNNNYPVVQIGTQTWMAENLKTTKNRDGSAIPLVTSNVNWLNASGPGYCWYKDSIKYENISGALYNWFAVNTGIICPTGWHVPDTTEWNTLIVYLGGSAGGEMKEACSSLWVNPNTGATNSSGFTGLPGGYRDGGIGSYYDMGYAGYWWSATEANNSSFPWYCQLIFNNSAVSLTNSLNYNTTGFSVRCVK